MGCLHYFTRRLWVASLAVVLFGVDLKSQFMVSFVTHVKVGQLELM